MVFFVAISIGVHRHRKNELFQNVHIGKNSSLSSNTSVRISILIIERPLYSIQKMTIFEHLAVENTLKRLPIHQKQYF